MQRPKSNQNIQVYVRVRPTNSREKCIRSLEVVEVSAPKEILVKQTFDSKTKKFTFDRSFGPDSLQSEVYGSVVAPMIQEVLAGYNCTVFAYGQTGTGKTYTMIGEEPETKTFVDDDNTSGIIPRALNHLFDELRLSELEFSMRVSYLELYNEELCDLLSSDDATKIRIYDDAAKKGSVIVQGLEEIPVHSKNDVYRLLAKGQDRRRTAATLMNAQSSRSHTVFSILVHIKENGVDGEEMLKIGKLNLVDLAGSENISKAGNEKGIRTRETVNINQSLLTLGRVITALVERTPHIPYRESKLTRILQESLGGRTKTSIIATISPGHKDLEETLSTLDYAHRAKNIQNKPEINQRLTKKTVLKEYTEEIDRLKRELMASRDKNGIYLPEETFNDLQYQIESQNKEINDKMQHIKALKSELSNKQKIFSEVSLNLIEKTEQLKSTKQVLGVKEKELGHTKKLLNSTTLKYNEKKFVLEKHQETEEKLTQQAKELLSVAEIASTDSIQLQSAIDRRKAADTKIVSACDQFSTTINSILNRTVTNMDDFKNNYDNTSDYILTELDANMKSSREFLNTFITNLNIVSGQQDVSIMNIKQLLNAFSTELNTSVTNDHEQIKQAVSALEMKLNEILNFSEVSMFHKCSEIINQMQQQKLVHDEKYEKLKQLYLEDKLRTVNFIESQKMILQNNFTKIEQNYNRNVNTINSNTNQNRDLIKKQINDLETFYTSFKANFEMMNSVNGNVAKIGNSMSDEMVEIQHDFELQSNEHGNFHDKLTKDKVIESQIDEIKLDYSKDYNTNKEQVDSVVNTKAEFKNYISTIQNNLENVITTSEGNVQKLTGHVTNSTQCVNNDLGELTEMLNTTSNSVKNVIEEEHCRLNNSKLHAYSFQQTLHKSVGEFHENVMSNLKDFGVKFNEFTENEIQTYSSTGMTPAKRSYPIQRNLVATSPQERLVQRFKQQYTPISDLDVSQSILLEMSSNENDLSSSSSFTPNLSNLENYLNSTQTTAIESEIGLLASSPEYDKTPLQPLNNFSDLSNITNNLCMSNIKNTSYITDSTPSKSKFDTIQEPVLLNKENIL